MKTKTVLRLISLLMLIAAIVFFIYACAHPESGSVFYIFGIAIGADAWRMFYAVYGIIMIFLFVTSFLVNKADKKK